MSKAAAALGLLNLWTFILFWHDKRRAVRGGRRVSEAGLLWCAALGGWGGALAGRHLFHHKTRKQPFASLLLLIAGTEAAALSWWLIRGAPLPADAERLLLAL